MRASIMTDATQLVICVGFFIALLAVLGSKMPTGWDWNPSGAPQPRAHHDGATVHFVEDTTAIPMVPQSSFSMIVGIAHDTLVSSH